jgi:hypothetical protein
MNSFYVYVYFRPDGSPCYIGKGKGSRWKKFMGHNQSVRDLAKNSSGELPCVIIREGLSEKEAFDIEMAFVKAIGRNQLLNGTDGGERPPSQTGRNHTASTKSIMRERKIGKPLSAEHRSTISAALSGRGMSEETRKKISETRKGVVFSEETKRKLSVAKIGTKIPDAVRAKMSAAQKGKILSDSHRAAIKASWVLRKERAASCV